MSYELLVSNITRNRLGERAIALHGDLREVRPGPLFDLVTGSPPYWDVSEGVVPADSQKAHARFELRGDVRDYARLFMMPGVLHCFGGPGPDTADWASVIDQWVERGQAPDRIIARKTVSGTTTRTRPLCPYPQRAVYNGSGSMEEESSFTCK